MTKTKPERKDRRSNGVAINIRGISPELRSEFKSICAAQDLTMTKAVVGLIRKTIDDPEDLSFYVHDGDFA